MEKLSETKIEDMEHYLSFMRNGMQDKLFFTDKLFETVDTYVDFGCADGSMLKSLRFLIPDKRLIGYDISDEMIKNAKANAPECEFYSRWDNIDIDFRKACIILSSVIHEVYSYGTKEDIELFWSRVFGCGFKYVIIRDMMFGKNDPSPLSCKDIAKIKGSESYKKSICDYEEINGKISTAKDGLHFLLKYQYTENWQREVRENYW